MRTLPLLILMLVFAVAASAASQQIQKAGTEVKTAYFSLKIPEGWLMPMPVKKQPNGGISAVFAQEKGAVTATLNVMPATVNIPEYIDKMSADMRKNGLQATPPEKKDGLYRIKISGKIRGEAWFGSSDKLFAAIIMFGDDLRDANQLLAGLKPIQPGLFPRSIE